MRKLENQKQLIKESAVKLLKDGTSNLSIRKIANDCGISIGTVYNYYDNKNEITLDIIADFWIAFAKRISILIGECDSSVDALQKVFTELKKTSSEFRYNVLTKDTTDEQLIQKGSKRHNTAYKIFIRLINECLNLDKSFTDPALPEFIAYNFMGMIKTPGYKYELFETVLLKMKEN
ncbi:TetR/AcrR family transcriptional regulator [Mycoplasmatota bacterium zrk1]